MGNTTPVDVVEVDLVRRQGDVSGTLISLVSQGNPLNIGGWTFTFSTSPGGTLLTTQWTTPMGNPSGLPMTTASSFAIPSYNSLVSIMVPSTTGILGGDYLQIPGFGVCQVKSVDSATSMTLFNNGFPGNAGSGTTINNVNVYEASNVGQTVLVIPSSITNWNSGNSVGRSQYYLKYSTNDPLPGPYKKTFYQGYLWIQPQNDPTA